MLTTSLIGLGVTLIYLAVTDAWDWRWVEHELTRKHREDLWRQYAEQRWGRP